MPLWALVVSLPPGLPHTVMESSPPATDAVDTTLVRGVPRLILTTDTDTLLPSTDTDTALLTMEDTPLLSQPGLPRVFMESTDTTSERGALRLTHPTDTDMLLPSTDTDTESASSTPADTLPSTSLDCTRGRLRLSLRPMLTTDMDTVSDTDTVWDTDIIWDTMVWDTPMVDTMAMDTVMDMDTATTDKPGACAIYCFFFDNKI